VTRRRLVGAALVVLMVLIAFALSRAGVSLSASDPLQSADAIVVINGKVPFRAMKGADLYRQRLAPEVWLTMGNRNSAEVEMERLGVPPTLEHVYSQAVLEKLGVPATAIHVIPGRNNNTATEMKTIAAYARQRRVVSVLLVTSSYHSRRVRSLWHQLVGESPQAIVQFTDEEPFNAGRWWADSADAWAVSREWFGLLNAWLGFPVSSEHW
jgi:uncharacterized SAM-binding protein YcdF (DUF218 family)